MTAEVRSDPGQPDASPAIIQGMETEPGQIAVRMSSDGIIRIKLPVNATVTGAQAEDASKAVRAIAQGNFHPILMEVTGVVSVSRGAREVYNRSETGCAYALLGQSPVDRVLAHHFLAPGSPDRPAAYFTSETEAIAWLGRQNCER